MGRYDVLAKRATAAPELAGAGKAVSTRRGNPAYRQFSAHIPVELYRQLKVRLAESDVALSQAVKQALTDWLAEKRSR